MNTATNTATNTTTNTATNSPRTSALTLGLKKTTAVLSAAALCATLLLAPAHAGRTLGPADQVETVTAADTDIYRITFTGGERATIEAEGYGSGDIDMYVYDEDGVRVDFDALSDNNPMCFFTPDYTQQFTIHIVNCSSHAVDYHLTTD